MSCNSNSSDLQLAWDTYKEFEAFTRKSDDDLSHFIEEWKKKMAKVQSAGCQYSNILLGLKLMDKVNLSNDAVVSIISKLGSLNPSSEGFLAQVVANVKDQIDYIGLNGSERETKRNNDLRTNGVGHDVFEELDTNLLSCSECPVKFMDEESLSKHYLEFHPDITRTKVTKSKKGTRSHAGFLKCPICDKNFMLSETLKKHVRNHDDSMFGSDGNDSFVEQSWLETSDIDAESHIDATILKAKIKEEIKIEASKELESKKGLGNTFKCSVCPNEYERLWMLNQHMEVHKTTRDHKCSYCDNAYKGKDGLKKHILRVHLQEHSKETSLISSIDGINSSEMDAEYPKDETILKPKVKKKLKSAAFKDFDGSGTTYKCKICPKEYEKLWMVNKHMKIHRESRDYKCSYCENTYKGRDGLRKHLLRRHLKEQCRTKENPDDKKPSVPRRKLPCEICGKPISEDGMKIHIKRHLAEHFKCSVCPKEFTKLALLKKHMVSHNQSHECSLCQKQFRTAHLLKVHMHTHRTTRDFICSFCGKEYKTKVTLREHLNLHTKAHEIPCKFCDKVFFAYSSWRFHVRAHHTGEKPYKCDFCEKSFYNSNRKANHMRTHTGEKPFQCQGCGKSFRENNTLKRHVKNVHKDVKLGDF